MTTIELLGRLLEWSGFALVAEAVLLTLVLMALEDDTDRLSNALLTGTLFLGGTVEVVGMVLAA